METINQGGIGAHTTSFFGLGGLSFTAYSRRSLRATLIQTQIPYPLCYSFFLASKDIKFWSPK